MTNLNFVKLNTVCERITDGSHYSPVGIDNGLPMLSVKDMEHNGFSYLDCKYISEEEYDKMLRNDCVPLLNDVLIAKDGSYLKHVFVIKEEKKQAILSSIGILRPNLKKISPDYLKYYLHSNSVKETVAKKYVSGSALPRIILKNFGEIDIIYKPLLEQQKIAKVLSDLDAKIELNNKINAELEAMAKTLYDYWFVQFDFPNANGKPYKTSGGKMVWNEELKREIPEGWEVKELGNELSIQRGISYKSSEIKGDGVSMISLNSFNLDGTYKPEGIKKFSGKYAEKNLISEGDLLIAITDVTRNADIIGKAIIVPDYYSELVISMDIAKVIPSKKLTESYLMMLFNSNHYHNYIKWYASGTIVLHLNLDGMFWYKAEIPPKELLYEFDKIYKSISKRIAETKKQNQELASLRDWLLPMLMNGQVTVGGYEVENSELGMVAEDKVEYKKS
ncbi:type I restriction enzyme S subunit [Flavobacterium aquaticum]|uniref:Type I restriction enzyme S subunit n=1 Tax=Flavobacterium aquaticum TaxID=1236486 RepID=A0A327YFG8_9FLAO|nr:restriction endonuclease subunit S [Flavobacterium aquaticum]RAK19604.1 type I restriction enzyme S subunit [Flavobacterium aquaticum]